MFMFFPTARLRLVFRPTITRLPAIRRRKLSATLAVRSMRLGSMQAGRGEALGFYIDAAFRTPQPELSPGKPNPFQSAKAVSNLQGLMSPLQPATTRSILFGRRRPRRAIGGP